MSDYPDIVITWPPGGSTPAPAPAPDSGTGGSLGELLDYLFSYQPPADEFADSNEFDESDKSWGDAAGEKHPGGGGPGSNRQEQHGNQEKQQQPGGPQQQWGEMKKPPPPSVPENEVIEGFVALCKAGQIKGLSEDALKALWKSVGQFIQGQLTAAAATDNHDLVAWWTEVKAKKEAIEGGWTGASSKVSSKWFADIQKIVEQKAMDD